MDGNFYGTSAQVVGAKSSPGTYQGCPERGSVHLAEAGIQAKQCRSNEPRALHAACSPARGDQVLVPLQSGSLLGSFVF
jgi:hypothetical protein